MKTTAPPRSGAVTPCRRASRRCHLHTARTSLTSSRFSSSGFFTTWKRNVKGRLSVHCRWPTCWVQANYADATEATHGDRTIAQAELALKRQTMAHKRLLSALKTLAEVRRLMVPTLQVNIAEQQVNVAPVGA